MRAQRRPQDVHTAQFTVGGSRIQTSNLGLLPPLSLRVREAKHSFPCLWKDPNPLAPEQRTPDPHQLGSAPHKPPSRMLAQGAPGTRWVSRVLSLLLSPRLLLRKTEFGSDRF